MNNTTETTNQPPTIIVKPPLWAVIGPLSAWMIIGAGSWSGSLLAPSIVLLIALIVTTLSAVYHAEVVAHRIGEPYGTLVLALAVTVIEVALILAMMINGGAAKSGLARDAVYATVMIVCNGIVGLCLMAGGMRYHVQDFQLQGASSALAILAVLTFLIFMVPNVTSSTDGPVLNELQLGFVGIVSLVLYGSLVFVQTVSHRFFFLPSGKGEACGHAPAPSNRTTLFSLALLLLSLGAVIILIKMLTPALEHILRDFHLPKATAGIFIASLILMPEGLAAFRAARANRLQTSLNLALGSALASIGLTIPAVAVLSIITGRQLELGLDMKEMVLLLLTLFLGVITLGTGRTTFLQGIVHFVLFITYLFFTIIP